MERVTYNEVDAVIREFQPSNIPTFSLEEHLPVIKKTFYAKSVGEIFENLRAENSEWSKEQLKTLSKMSPTSLKVTFKQLENGGKMKFDEVFTMEYRLAQRFLEDHDFFEGCRAILIDKDRNPKWVPERVEDVTDAVVERYFAPLGRDDLIFDD